MGFEEDLVTVIPNNPINDQITVRFSIDNINISSILNLDRYK
jgi:hypothetical protein